MVAREIQLDAPMFWTYLLISYMNLAGRYVLASCVVSARRNFVPYHLPRNYLLLLVLFLRIYLLSHVFFYFSASLSSP